MNKAILFFYPFAFKYNDYERLELNFLEKKNNLFVFELLDFLYPHFKKVYLRRVSHKNIYSIKNEKEIKGKLNEILKKFKNNQIYVINNIHNINFKSTNLNIFLNNKFQNHIRFINPGQRIYSYNELHPKNNLYYLRIFLSKLRDNKKTFFNIKVRLYNFFYNLYAYKKDTFYFIGGNYYIKNSIKKIDNSKIIRFHHWDVSRAIISKKIKLKNPKSIVYIDYPDPNYEMENSLYGVRNILTPSEWFSQLNNFFTIIEKKLDRKVIICPHPLTPATKSYKKEFSNFKIIENETMESIYNSDLVIHVGSTALSYAVIFNKPMLLIYNNALKNNLKGENINKMSKDLGSNLINIESDDLNQLDYSKFMKINESKYNKYKSNFLSSKKSQIPNYKIISDFVNK